jgi:hypothetical protein
VRRGAFYLLSALALAPWRLDSRAEVQSLPLLGPCVGSSGVWRLLWLCSCVWPSLGPAVHAVAMAAGSSGSCQLLCAGCRGVQDAGRCSPRSSVLRPGCLMCLALAARRLRPVCGTLRLKALCCARCPNRQEMCGQCGAYCLPTR